MMEMTATKKPVSIVAVMWDGSFSEAGEVIDWMRGYDPEVRIEFKETNETVHKKHSEIRIQTLKGKMAVSPGDWIIRGIKGDFYPCPPDIFEASYDYIK